MSPRLVWSDALRKLVPAPEETPEPVDPFKSFNTPGPETEIVFKDQAALFASIRESSRALAEAEAAASRAREELASRVRSALEAGATFRGVAAESGLSLAAVQRLARRP